MDPSDSFGNQLNDAWIEIGNLSPLAIVIVSCLVALGFLPFILCLTCIIVCMKRQHFVNAMTVKERSSSTRLNRSIEAEDGSILQMGGPLGQNAIPLPGMTINVEARRKLNVSNEKIFQPAKSYSAPNRNFDSS